MSKSRRTSKPYAPYPDGAQGEVGRWSPTNPALQAPVMYLYLSPGEVHLCAEAFNDLHTQLVSDHYKGAGVMCVGPASVGKSSFLNTIASFVSGKLEHTAPVGISKDCFTLKNRVHMPLHQGAPVDWKWLDTPGSVFTELVKAWEHTQLAVDATDYMTEDAYASKLENDVFAHLKQQRLGCLMACLSVKDVKFTTPDRTGSGSVGAANITWTTTFQSQLQMLKDLYQRVIRKGFRMLVLLTQVDLYFGTLTSTMMNMMCSEQCDGLRLCVARELGVQANQVHMLVNLVREYQPRGNLQLGYVAFIALQSALSAAQICEALDSDQANGKVNGTDCAEGGAADGDDAKMAS